MQIYFRAALVSPKRITNLIIKKYVSEGFYLLEFVRYNNNVNT